MIVGKFLNQFISFGVVWIQVHFLSVWAYGIFGLFMGTVLYVAALGSAGTPDIARRFLPEFAEQDKNREIAITVRALLIIRLIVSALVLGLILLFYDYIGPILNIGDYRSAFALFSVGILIAMEARLMYVVNWALLQQLRYMIVFTAYNIVRIVAFYLILKNGGGLVGALTAEIITQIIFFLAMYFPFSCQFDYRSKSEDYKLPVKRMIKYGIYMYYGNFGQVLFNTTTDLYVISAFLDPIKLGYYAFSVNIGQAIMKWMPTKLIGSVIQPIVYRDYTRRGSSAALPEQFSRIISAEAFFTIPTVMFLISFSEPLIREIFDPKYLPARWILAVLSITFAVVALRFPLDLVATSLEKVKILFTTQVVFSIYNIVMDIILVPIWGLWGAVAATSSALVFLVISIWILLSKHIELGVEIGSLLKISINSLVMGGYFWFFKDKVGGLGEFIAILIGGGLIYILMSFVNRPFDDETIDQVKTYLGK